MNFEIAIQRLCDTGVQFVVIGGWSAIFHGSAHVTNDLNICYLRDRVFTLTTDLGIVDLLAEVSGVGTYADALSVSVEVDAFERRVRTLDLHALIKAKKAAGRQKDLLMLPELESLLEARGED